MTRAYRVLLVSSGVLLLAGGSLHPDADPSGSITDDLAEMTADPSWVTGHALTALATVLLAAGLWALHRRGGLPVRTTRAFRVAAVAVSLYVVETLFHLAAGVDSEALAAGELAPVAGGHVLLSAVLYPASGAALVLLGLALLQESRGLRRAVAGAAVLGGTLHALAVPLVLVRPDVDGAPLFAGGAVLIALWSGLTGLIGVPTERPLTAAAPRAVQPVG